MKNDLSEILKEIEKQRILALQLEDEKIIIKKYFEKISQENIVQINKIVRDPQNMLKVVKLASKHPAYVRFMSRKSSRFAVNPGPWKYVIASQLWFGYSRNEEVTISFVFTERDLKEYTHIILGLRLLAWHLGLNIKRKKKVDKYCSFLTFYSKNTKKN